MKILTRHLLLRSCGSEEGLKSKVPARERKISMRNRISKRLKRYVSEMDSDVQFVSDEMDKEHNFDPVCENLNRALCTVEFEKLHVPVTARVGI